MNIQARRMTLASVLLPAALAACGGSGSGYSSGAPAAASPTAATSPSPAPSAAAAPAAVVGSATAMVAGKSQTILADTQGLTLYYNTRDSATTASCTGGCATNWPPLVLTSGTPTASAGVTGSMSVLDGPNGRQVLYNGHPLYRFVSDKAAGDTKGEGIGGVWHVASTTLT
jgi:predicted lipoprotein with Yx(FWY)xxD motif